MTQYFGKYRGTVVNNIDPMQMGRIQAIVPDVTSVLPTSWALPCVPMAGPQAGAVRGAADRRRRSGSSSSRAIPTIRSGPAASGARPPRCRRWRWRLRRRLQTIVLQTIGQNTLMISDVPGPTGGILLKTATGALISINDVGITISNGKGATIMLTGPSVTINKGALAVI